MATETQIKEFKDRMEANWEFVHWFYECTDSTEYGQFIDDHGGVDGAMIEARRHTDLMNEMQRNCY